MSDIPEGLERTQDANDKFQKLYLYAEGAGCPGGCPRILRERN